MIFNFYVEDPHTGFLQVQDDPFNYDLDEMFIARGSYGKERTLRRFKKELSLRGLDSLKDKVTLRDVKKHWRVSRGSYGSYVSEKEEGKAFPIWVVDVCKILDREE